MNDICTYQIRLEGEVSQDEINASSPAEATVEHSDATSTLLSIHIDQSGLIGLLRYLHGKGFVLLSVNRAAAA